MTYPRKILPASTYLLTRSTVAGIFLLRADDRTNRAFRYFLVQAARKHHIEIHGYCVMSNHYHMVVTDTVGNIPHFTAWFNRRFSMWLKRHRSWNSSVFSSEKTNMTQLTTEQAVWDKLAYTFCNPVSAGLVKHARHYPGAISFPESRFITASRPKRHMGKYSTIRNKEVSLELTIPAALAYLDQGSYREQLRDLCDKREQESREAAIEKYGRFLGSKAVRQTSYRTQSKTIFKYGLNPSFAAVTKEGLIEANKKMRAFYNAYKEAKSNLLKGFKDVVFPAGTWWMRIHHQHQCVPPGMDECY